MGFGLPKEKEKGNHLVDDFVGSDSRLAKNSQKQGEGGGCSAPFRNLQEGKPPLNPTQRWNPKKSDFFSSLRGKKKKREGKVKH